MTEVDSDGFIVSFGPYNGQDVTDVIHVPDGSFILPTFCDLHLHAPQFLYQGTGLHLPLMEWLNEYAFKAEEKLDADSDLAERVYRRLARRLIEGGTGAVSLFGTIKEETKSVVSFQGVKILWILNSTVLCGQSSPSQGHERGWPASVYLEAVDGHLKPAILRRTFRSGFPRFRNVIRREVLRIGRGKRPSPYRANIDASIRTNLFGRSAAWTRGTRCSGEELDSVTHPESPC